MFAIIDDPMQLDPGTLALIAETMLESIVGALAALTPRQRGRRGYTRAAQGPGWRSWSAQSRGGARA
ncbi:MAG: hypothetical protein IPN92_01590 [Chromatiaceae bacterium]|nr:hypothetical protein [Chromatiaceae bacterium]